MKKKYRVIISLLVVVILLATVFRKQLYSIFVYQETTLKTGCINGFCLGDTKKVLLNKLQSDDSLKVAYNDGISVKIVSAKQFSGLSWHNFERLSLFSHGAFHTETAFHLTFSNDEVSSIQKEYHGPFYFDL